MSTVMEPPATFEFESPVRVETTPSREAVLLDQMIEAANEGNWIVNALTDRRGGNCALGMIARYGYGVPDNPIDMTQFEWRRNEPLYDLLIAAIPVGGARGFWIHQIVNYNNSLTSADEAVAWFERAKALA